jgi:hypothetical protein
MPEKLFSWQSHVFRSFVWCADAIAGRFHLNVLWDKCFKVAKGLIAAHHLALRAYGGACCS